MNFYLSNYVNKFSLINESWKRMNKKQERRFFPYWINKYTIINNVIVGKYIFFQKLIKQLKLNYLSLFGPLLFPDLAHFKSILGICLSLFLIRSCLCSINNILWYSFAYIIVVVNRYIVSCGRVSVLLKITVKLLF